MAESTQVHGSAIALNDNALLITGASGSGKSTLALEMIALGAELVADDRVDLIRQGDAILASAPETIAGQIEARGIGLIRMPFRTDTQIVMIADMDQFETERLPRPRNRDLLGIPCPVILAKDRMGLAAILMSALRYGLQQID